jgi:diguanylate cyclase (GGDEF)-like protein/PAS domain S-box-containing protein
MDDQPSSSLSASFTDAAQAARVAMLYRQAIPGILATLAIAGTLTAVLWHAATPLRLGEWLAAIGIITSLHYVLVWRYRTRNRANDAAAWERRYALNTGVLGVACGALVFLIDPASYTLKMLVAFAVGIMAIGAMGVLAGSKPAFCLFAVPVLGAPALEFLWLGGELYLPMGILVLILFAAILQVFSNLHGTISENIERGIANERLIAGQRALIDATTVGIAFVRSETIVGCNLQFERILGWSRQELSGAPFRGCFADEASWQALMGSYGASPSEAYRGEIELKRRDGTLVWCDVTRQVANDGGPVGAAVISCADTTERKAAEARLRASEERLDLVISAAQSGIWDWDIRTEATYFSERFKEILGHSRDADFARSFSLANRLHPDDRDRILKAERRCVEQDVAFDHEYRLQRADGTYVWVHGRGRAVRDASGTATRFLGSLIDISDRKQVEERLRQSESHFRHLVETANALVWAVDSEGRWTYLSPRATRQIFGCEPEDMLRRRLVDSQPDSHRERTLAMLARVLADGTASHFETVHVNRKGGEVVLTLNATPLRGAGGAIVGVTGTATEITELKAKEAALSNALAEQQLIFESVSEGIVLLKNRVVTKCNRKFAEMLAYDPEELVGQPSVAWFADPAEWERVGREAHAAMSQAGEYEADLLVKRKNGTTFWCEIRGRAIDSRRPHDDAVYVMIDISARKERENRIQHLADHDALTGLLNRRLLEDRLQQAITIARRSESMVAVMLMDLDGFKAVNDQFGHLMGDYVLRVVGKRLRECVRESDTVARLGGDEFVVVVGGQRSADDSSVVAEKILGALTEPVAAGGRRFEIGGSIGISVFPRDGATPESLIKQADAAMYRVKDAGKNRYEFYSS